MWMHKESKWLVRGGRKVRCYLCGKKILKKDLFMFHENTGYYSHNFCIMEANTIDRNERRRAVKKIAVGAAVAGAMAAGAGKFIDISSQSKGSLNSPDTQTILTSQGLILPSLTSDPANPVAGQMWYRSDAGVTAHFDAVQNRVVYSSEINDGNVHDTSKGIINGLSVLPNDGTGWFGPDTTKGATATGQYGGTYTETMGTNEMFNYFASKNVGGRVYFSAGQFIFNATATYTGTVPISLYGVYSNIQGGAKQPGTVLMPGSDLSSGSYLISFDSSLSGATEYYGMEGFDIYGQTVSPSTATTSDYNGIYCGSAAQAIFKNIHTSQINTAFYIDVEFWGENIIFDSYTTTGIEVDSTFGSQLTILNNIVTYNVGTLINSQVSASTTGGVILLSQLSTSTSDGEYLIKLSSTSMRISEFETDNGGTTGSEEGIYLGSNATIHIANSSIYGQFTADPTSPDNCGISMSNVKCTNTSSSAIDIVDYTGTGNWTFFWYGGSRSGTAFDYPTTNGATIFRIKNVFNVDIASRYTGSISPTPSLTANPPVSGTVYLNTNPYDIEIELPVYATTAGTAGYVTIAKGASSTPTTIGNQYVSGDTSSTSTQIIRLRVPALWTYSLTASGVTFGTASVFAE